MNHNLESSIFSILKKDEIVFCYEKACELQDLSSIYGNRYYFYHTNKKLKALSYSSKDRWNTGSRVIPIYKESFDGLTIVDRYGFPTLSIDCVLTEMLEQKYDYFMQMTYEAFSNLWEEHNHNWDFVLRLCDTADKLKFFNEIREDCEEYYCD